MELTKTKSGFSLIELLVVVGLTSILGLAISAVLLTSLTNSARIRAQSKIKAAGDYTITQIQSLVRNSREVTSCNSTTNTIVLVNQDRETTTLALSGTAIASNSATLTPANQTVSNFDLNCEPSNTNPRLINLAFDLSLTSANLRLGESPSLHFATSILVRNE